MLRYTREKKLSMQNYTDLRIDMLEQIISCLPQKETVRVYDRGNNIWHDVYEAGPDCTGGLVFTINNTPDEAPVPSAMPQASSYFPKELTDLYDIKPYDKTEATFVSGKYANPPAFTKLDRYEYKPGDIIILNDSMGKFAVAEVAETGSDVVMARIRGINNGVYCETDDLQPLLTNTKKPCETPEQVAAVEEILNLLKRSQDEFNKLSVKI